MSRIFTMQQYSIQISTGTGGQIQVFINGTDNGYFRGTKTFTVNNGDSISVWCDADTGYTYTRLCIDGTSTCTTARPFNFTANMNVSMTATFTSASCTQQQDNTLLVNGKSGTVTITPGTVAAINIRSTNGIGMNWCLGATNPTWGIIARQSPLSPTELRIDSGTNYFDSNGCGTTSIAFNIEGTYTLVARACCAWNPLSGNIHCTETDTDFTNVVNVVVSSTSPPPSITCDPTKNLLVMNQCIPKPLIFAGAGLLFLFMITGKE